ncbi:MAG: hypothetical protein KF893_25590 [Caldilineaceae bacterium]|nr:hypothetical protein [Caldilineaceae bacterium]
MKDNLRTRVTEEWIATDTDNRGRPRSFAIVEHEPQPPIVIDDAQPIISPLPEARTQRAMAIVEGSYTDRAKAFSIKTWQIATITGLAMTLAAYFWGGIAGAILSAYFFGGFLLVWLIAYLLDVFASAEGTQLLETVFLWQFLKREQSERHRRYGAPQPKLSTVDKVFGLLLTGVVLLWLLAWLLIESGVFA